MEISNKKPNTSFVEAYKKILKPVYVLILMISLIAGFSYGFLYKFKIYNQIDKYYMSLGFPSHVRENGLFKETLKLISNYKFKTPFVSNDDLDSFDVEIKFKHLYKLYNKKNQALKLGSLISEDSDYVSAKINHHGRKIPVKLRLKGDMLDHLEGRKWSYRVKTKKGDHFKGMRVFSIQHPMTRGYHWEPLFYKFLREFNIITPRYFFNNMTLNGEDIGIMAIEEHFSKEILESQNRRESVILRFDESDSRAGLLDGSAHSHMAQNAYIKPFRSSKVFKNKKFKDIYLSTTAKIQSYIKGELEASQLFNLDAMAMYIAICEIWNAEHGLWWTNMRFYVNPVTMLLEPVAFDNESLHFNHNIKLAFHSANTIFPVANLMQEIEFRKLVHEKLIKIKKEVGSKDLWKTIAEEEQVLRQELAGEFPLIFKIPINKYKSRLEKLTSIAPKDMLYEKR